MTGPELRARLDALFGPVATTDKAAVALHVTRRSVDRWVAGDVLVPGPVVAWLELLKEADDTQTLRASWADPIPERIRELMSD